MTPQSPLFALILLIILSSTFLESQLKILWMKAKRWTIILQILSMTTNQNAHVTMNMNKTTFPSLSLKLSMTTEMCEDTHVPIFQEQMLLDSDSDVDLEEKHGPKLLFAIDSTLPAPKPRPVTARSWPPLVKSNGKPPTAEELKHHFGFKTAKLKAGSTL
ncbi:hypothetical protein BC830DRAFT_1220007 [Chytriomyces sp. MP71]|nr:hypothetical protein BC830DRAFT_1220007 [Chytriomyces sp. MP71]